MRSSSLLGPPVLGILLAIAQVACGGPEGGEVVLYCGVDEDQSRQVTERFETETGVDVDFHGESEAMRSVGLSHALEMERERPRADVYWANEIMHMVHLARVGVIDTLPEGVADGFPDAWRDPQGRFVAFGARARVLLVNTELLPDPADHPRSIEDLLDPRYAAMGLVTSMAEPLTGTTYTHAVALLTADEAPARRFFERVAAARAQGTMKVVSSNGRVMRLVKDASNKVAFGLTDTDDSWSAIREGRPVLVVYPDQEEGRPGTMLIPNTVGLVAGRRHAEAAERLVRWLVRPETEALLAAGPTAQIPLREGVPVPDEPRLRWKPGEDFRATRVDWHAVAANVDRWRDWLTRLFKPG